MQTRFASMVPLQPSPFAMAMPVAPAAVPANVASTPLAPVLEQPPAAVPQFAACSKTAKFGGVDGVIKNDSYNALIGKGAKLNLLA